MTVKFWWIIGSMACTCEHSPTALNRYLGSMLVSRRTLVTAIATHRNISSCKSMAALVVSAINGTWPIKRCSFAFESVFDLKSYQYVTWDYFKSPNFDWQNWFIIATENSNWLRLHLWCYLCLHDWQWLLYSKSFSFAVLVMLHDATIQCHIHNHWIISELNSFVTTGNSLVRLPYFQDSCPYLYLLVGVAVLNKIK